MYGLPAAHAARRLDEVITLFGLDEFVDDLTERYSHGMRQRTVFASALLHEPRVLVVDEPTVGLDPRSVRLLKDVLRRLAAGGTSVAVCRTCMEARGIVPESMLDGAHRSTLEELTRWTAEAGKVLVF